MLPAVAVALRRVGLTPTRFAAYAQSEVLAHVPRVRRSRTWGPATPRHAVPMLLWCDGAAVPLDAVTTAFGEHAQRLLASPLLQVSDGMVQARCAVLPVGEQFICCDFATDTQDNPVGWPDDSSHHLLGALPQAPVRYRRWLDVGTGPALAPLHRPRLAEAIVATDLNPRAIELASMGISLSGTSHITVAVADGVPALPPPGCDLLTFNAPMPAPVTHATWHFAPVQVLQAFLRAAPAHVNVNGVIIMHAMWTQLELATVQASGGQAKLLLYHPNPSALGFGVLWWQPHQAGTVVIEQRALSVTRPHIDAADQPRWHAEAA